MSKQLPKKTVMGTRWLVLTAGAVFIGVAVFWLSSPTQAYALDESKCLTCHGDTRLTKTNGNGEQISLFVNEKDANVGAHRYIDCTTCHTTDPHKVATPLTKLSLAQKCGTCHQYEYQHLNSVHGQQLAQGNSDVATCVDCHSDKANPHNVVRVLEYNAPTYKKNIAETCSKCHGNAEMMANYGIVEKVYESYMRSYHGKAIKLGTYEITQLDEATCTNCHGVHDIKSVADPISPVAGLDNLAKTCEQCHQGAGVEFAKGFLGHQEASLQNIPQAHVAEVFFNTLLKTVIGFGIALMLVATIRFSVDRWREEKNGRS